MHFIYRGIQMIRMTALFLLASALLGCTPKAEEPVNRSSSQATAPSAAESATTEEQSTEVDAASVFSALEGLGLTVFPEPQTIPAISLSALNGKPLTLAEQEGKYVFLNFWATWCPPCREEMPSIQRMNEALAGPDFAVFAVSVGEKPAVVESFLKKTPYSFPIALDPKGEISAMFAGRGIPTTYLLDRRGRAIAGVVGGRPWDTEEVLSAFKALMALE
jgi:thiol-disulfide isomerase/thioredoxin